MASSTQPEQATRDELILQGRARLLKTDLSSRERMEISINVAEKLAEIAEEKCDPGPCDEAIRLGEEALRLSGPQSEDRFAVQSKLSEVYLRYFERKNNDKSYLDKSLQLIKSARDAAPRNSSLRAGRNSSLTWVLCVMFQAFGDERHLRDAIDAFQETTLNSQLDPEIQAKGNLNGAWAIFMRYENFNNDTDLKKAIELAEKAIKLNTSRATQAECGVQLMIFFTAFAERFPLEKNFEFAVARGRKIHSELVGSLKGRCAHQLSYLLRLKSEAARAKQDPKDLQAALEYASEAVRLTIDNEYQAVHMDNFALCLEKKYRLEKEYRRWSSEDSLKSAIAQSRQAVALSSPVHPAIASYLSHLAHLLHLRGGEGDNEEAISRCKAVLGNKTAPALNRVTAGQLAVDIQRELQHWQEACKTIEETLGLVKDLVGNSLQRHDQQHTISRLSGLGRTGAYVAVKAGRSSYEAFSMLEQGQAILAELAIVSRSVFAARLHVVPEAKPFLQRHEELRSLLAGRPGTKGFSSSAMDSRLLQQYQEMRLLEDEMMGMASRHGIGIIKKSEKETVAQLHGDYAVVFVPTADQSFALILTSQGIRRMFLPQLKMQDVKKHVRLLLGKNRITEFDLNKYMERNEQLENALKWLWDVAVKPVLHELQLLGPRKTSSSRLPRICWISSGWMGLMPLHAAGYHTKNSTDYAMHYIISSYIVSARALTWCRERMTRTANHNRTQRLEHFEGSVITMRTTPGAASLDMIDEEITALSTALRHAKEVAQPSATKAATLLRSLHVAHFACHAEPGAPDPSAGGLLLYDAEKKAVDKLSIYSISHIDNPNAWLAYLSACQTADLQSRRFTDEAIHIASAIQLAGFPQVVGTLWEAEDEYAANIARGFYSNEALKATLNCRRALHRDTAVVALHEAIAKIREDDPGAVLSWAQFVIFGA